MSAVIPHLRHQAKALRFRHVPDHLPAGPFPSFKSALKEVLHFSIAYRNINTSFIMSATTNGSSVASTSTMSQAEQIARAAKEAFDAAQLLENGEQERVNALRLVRETLAAAKSDILHANSLDMEVGLCFLPSYALYIEAHIRLGNSNRRRTT
jgi:hypothetical protein